METSIALLPDSASLEDIDEELAFISVLEDSLDPGADDYDEKRREHEFCRRHYERMIERLQANVESSGEGHSAKSQNGTQASFHSAGNDNQLPDRDNWWRSAMESRADGNAGTSFNAASNSHTTPSHGIQFGTPSNLMKRPMPNSSYLNTEHATKRPTPDPSNAGTPASSSGSSELNLSRDASASQFDKFRAQQAAAEAAARRRREAEAADAKLAADLSRELSASKPSAFGPSSSSSRSAFQTTLKHGGGGYHRPGPVKQESSVKQKSSAMPDSQYVYGQPSQPLYRHQSMARPSPSQSIKPEPGILQTQHVAQRPRQPTAVVDLTGSDSDEDVAEVRQNILNPQQRSSFAPASQWSGRPLPTMQMPGAFPSSSGTNHPLSNGYHVFGSQNPRAGYSAPYSQGLIGQATSGLQSAVSGIGSHMRQLQDILGGSSARPMALDDSDDDEVSFRGARQIPGMGGYAGNEHLYNTRYDQLAAYDPTQSKEEIQALLNNIRPDEDMPAHLRVQTPADMSVNLHKYQEMGLTWLTNCEEGSNQGGILADDMGLGKTIQMLSLMVTHKSEDPRCKTTLIVAPVALMRQWKQEIQDKLKPGRAALTVFTHHGTKKAKSFQELRTYDVVLTTYGSLASELKKMEKFHLRKVQDPSARPYPKEQCVFLDPDAYWYRVVLDEAQCIKNKGTQAAKGACMLRAKYRFCVTGTPMMNNVEELFSLVHFLRIKPYCTWEKFRLDFVTPLKSSGEDTKGQAMRRLQALCKAIMLRRTKKSTFEGKPILVLPDRKTEVVNPEFNDDEKSFYQALETQSQITFNKYLRKGTVGTQYSAILVLLLRLRQACCHPHLIKDFGVEAAADMSEEQMVEFARELSDAVVARIKETNGNFECPVCYDVTPNPAIFIPCGHDTCSECFTRIADPANALQNGEEATHVRCPNCRGNIDPKRLTDYNSFKKVHLPEIAAEDAANGDAVTEQNDSDSDDSDDSSSESESDSDDDGSLGGFIVNDDVEDDEEDENDENDDDMMHRNGVKAEDRGEGVAGPSTASGRKAKSKRNKSKKGKGRDKGKGEGKGKMPKKKVKSTKTLAELKKLSSRSKEHKKKYLKKLRKSYVGSAKIDKTVELLKGIMDDPEGEKVLIFSQWTSLLDLLEIPIDDAGWGYRRYDGSMSAPMRGDAVDDFKDAKKDVRIMLVSLKAGNAGLNLNVASQVIILDPFWNPYIEEQAIDRAHRIGQLREVVVHRVLIEETVEDRIIALQEKKRALISEALDEQSGANVARLGVQELAYLFGVTHDPSQRVNYTARQSRR
ncbi:unnamed protein product [Zymoseptoria tritici ST99CH_1A5]|uniref:RING-type domain-containing protein n=1 Tax=Zymoseptoria tritici ST99CH_1A5 TaxID=1276529 RepID=A0A1Y6L3E6_ZYMTR|nr:unnamed protein product [Zymoseptoria tritici ST99CH_1A5]